MRLFRRETTADMFFSEQPDMSIQFLGEIVVAMTGDETSEQAAPHATPCASHASILSALQDVGLCAHMGFEISMAGVLCETHR